MSTSDLYIDGLILVHNGISINTRNSIDIWYSWIKDIYYRMYYFNLPIEIDQKYIDLQAFTVGSIKAIMYEEQKKAQPKKKRRG